MNIKPYTKTITWQEVYGTDTLPDLPDDYEYTGEFDYVHNRPDETLWVSLSGVVHQSYGEFEQPRLIVRKKPIKPTVESVYGTDKPAVPEGYAVDGEIERVEVGKSYLSSGGLVSFRIDDVRFIENTWYRLPLRKMEKKRVLVAEYEIVPNGGRPGSKEFNESTANRLASKLPHIYRIEERWV